MTWKGLIRHKKKQQQQKQNSQPINHSQLTLTTDGTVSDCKRPTIPTIVLRVLTWIVFVMGGRWPYSWWFVGCCRQDLFNIARHILHPYSSIDTTAAWKKLRFILSVRFDFHMINSLSIAVHAFVHAEHCWRGRDELIRDVLLWTPPMAEQKQDDQLEHTYSSYVRIQDVALKTCRRRWTIGRSGERGSRISVLAARY